MNENTPDAAQMQLPTLDFKKEADQINTLLSSWADEETKCKKRRELRENRRSTHEERQKQVILEDETIIPDRTIDSGVNRAKVGYNTYITQSKRTLIITDVEAPQISEEQLELWFTRGMRYPEWKNPWFELNDSMLVHGGVAMEVVYDPERPFNVGLECIERGSLIFPLRTKNLQAVPRLLRKYELSSIQLEEFAETYEFNPNYVKELMDLYKQNDEFVNIYRVLMKIKGFVFNAWYSKECTKGWLRDPRPHDVGLIDFKPEVLLAPVQEVTVNPVDGSPVLAQVPLFLSKQWETGAREKLHKPQMLRAYPIYWFPLRVTENPHLLEGQGRVSLDMHVQEAMTCLLSDTVNGTHRASRFYPTAELEPGQDPKNLELGKLEHGRVLPGKITTFQPAYPNSIILACMQALKIGKADESGQMDFASTARKDANKTATEMKLANQQSDLLEVSDMDIYSSPVLSVYALCFNVACQQAIFKLCRRPPNPSQLIGDYNLQSAGDVEVVKRAEDKQNAKEFFSIVQGTPAAEKILVFLIQRFFPDQADEWIAALEQPDKNEIIKQLLSIIQTIPTDELTPEQRIAFRNLIVTAQHMVGVDSDETIPSGPGGETAGNTAQMPAPEQAQGT